MHEPNPFAFESDPKRFVQQLEQERNSVLEEDDETRQLPHYLQLYKAGHNASRYGLLARLEDQTNKLAQDRDEMFAREAKSKNPNKQKDEVAQRVMQFNPKLLEQKDKEVQKRSYRIRNILREKRETILDFVDKKRDICLVNFNILTKKDETNRLEDFIKNEQESLRARKMYFRNDCELVKRFMEEVKAQAEQATMQADKEAKKKDEVKGEVGKILAQIDRLKLQKTKSKEECERLSTYKDFLQQLKDNHKSKFKQLEEYYMQQGIEGQPSLGKQFFVTGVDAKPVDQQSEEEKQFQRKQDITAKIILDILNSMEEDNLRFIQNERDIEEEIEQKKRELEKHRDIFIDTKSRYNERLKTLERQYQSAHQQQQQLNNLEKIDQTKLSFQEGQDLDMEKLSKKIMEIWVEYTGKQDLVKKLLIDSRQVRSSFCEIEKGVTNLLNHKHQFFIKCNKDYIEFEKKQRQQKNKQRPSNTKEEERIIQTIERLRKGEEQTNKLHKGRQQMKRNYMQKMEVVKQEETEVDLNDDEKYLVEEYELGSTLPKQMTTQTQQTRQSIDQNINKIDD